MAKNTITMSQAKDLLNFTIDNNLKLQEKGMMPIALGLEATPGIGKTSLIEQVAKERKMNYVKLNLAQLEEAGDIIGFPFKEHEVQIAKLSRGKNGEPEVIVLPDTQWISEKMLENPDKSTKYKLTGRTRMSYAKPAWVPEYNDTGTILNMDDWSRANPQLIQAVMDLILTQKYVSWELPKKTTIFLTSNSDDGTNNVSSLDEAQSSRLLNYNVEFEIDSWLRWSQSVNLDDRCINFVANYFKELFEKDDEGNSICNPRSFCMFANMISNIKDWENKENLDTITMIARGCFKDEGGRFAQMFSSFIRNKMHLIIAPKDVLLGAWEKTKEKLVECIYDGGSDFRPDIASLVERRFANYVLAWLNSNEETPIAKVKDRIHAFLDFENSEGKALFNKDMYYHMIKTITSEKKSQTSKLLLDPRIAKLLN